jgi:hypothetical protein
VRPYSGQSICGWTFAGLENKEAFDQGRPTSLKILAQEEG